jgi:hypothetical protein
MHLRFINEVRDRRPNASVERMAEIQLMKPIVETNKACSS